MKDQPGFFQDPAFEPWWSDAEFRALVERSIELIDIERAKLGLGPLPSP